MREIRFRALFNDRYTGDSRFFYTSICYDCHTPPDFVQISDWEQYTGLKDKNGVEIYEGDIVAPVDGLAGGTNGRAIVEYHEGGFSPFAIPQWEITVSDSDVEVVGNIHENQELLQ